MNGQRDRIKCTCTIDPKTGEKRLCKHCFARAMTYDALADARRRR